MGVIRRALLLLAVLATVARAQPQNTAFAVRPFTRDISDTEISLLPSVGMRLADRVCHHSPMAS